MKGWDERKLKPWYRLCTGWLTALLSGSILFIYKRIAQIEYFYFLQFWRLGRWKGKHLRRTFLLLYKMGEGNILARWSGRVDVWTSASFPLPTEPLILWKPTLVTSPNSTYLSMVPRLKPIIKGYWGCGFQHMVILTSPTPNQLSSVKIWRSFL